MKSTTTSAFEDVYRAYKDRIYRFCLSQTGNPTEAEDVAAEVFTSALAAFARTAPDPAEVMTWLLRIARNAVIDRYRRQGRMRTLLARLFTVHDGEADQRVDVEREVVIRDELAQVLRAMRALKERDRVLVGLRYAAGLGHAEIAAVLGMSEHAATVASKRALEKLRRHCEVTP